MEENRSVSKIVEGFDIRESEKRIGVIHGKNWEIELEVKSVEKNNFFVIRKKRKNTDRFMLYKTY